MTMYDSYSAGISCYMYHGLGNVMSRLVEKRAQRAADEAALSWTRLRGEYGTQAVALQH